MEAMGAVGGLLSEDPRAVSADLERLVRGLTRRGSGAARQVTVGVGPERRGRCALVTRSPDPAAGAEADDGRWAADGDAILIWDGRLDNRAELGASLDIEVSTDADTALHAWRRWGDEAFGRLVGDFALVAVDLRQGRVLLARDTMGARPLFYGSFRHGLAWGSCLSALLPLPGVDDGLDPAWVGRFLSATPVWEHTPYAGLRQVRPGETLELRPGAVRLVARRPPQIRAWDGKADPDAMVEAYREIFDRAVARRLEGCAAVGADLSGGVDSSSIVCRARRLIGDGSLLPVSIVYRDSKTADESRFIAAVESHLGISSQRFVHEEQGSFGFVEPGADFYERPHVLDGVRCREQAVGDYLRHAGATVLLRGFGGDQVLWSENFAALEPADRLRQGRIGAFAAGLGRWSRILGQPRLSLIGCSVYGLLPGGLRRRWGLERSRLQSWLAADFVDRLDLHRLAFWESPLRELYGDELPALPTLRHRLFEVADAVAGVSAYTDVGPFGLHHAYPFLDRDLVEFCLGLPFDALVQGAETRWVHRRALEGEVPSVVLDRCRKTTMTEAFLRTLHLDWGRVEPLLRGMKTADLGFVDGDEVRRRLQRARFGSAEDLVGMMPLLSLEGWLQRREGRRAGVSAAAA